MFKFISQLVGSIGKQHRLLDLDLFFKLKMSEDLDANTFSVTPSTRHTENLK